jgi:ubiquinone/menaquinone biosynthesis C-methylase UbiE
MMTKQEAAAKAAATYNAASSCYDEPALSFWDRFGQRTVERLILTPGMHVLDVCCGSGASTLPAAERVRPGGQVLAVDLAENLLALGRAKAAHRQLENIEFRAADFESLGLPGESFDAVICVFGIFFVPDMAQAARELWRMVRRGGQLAITTWGQDLFEPGNSIFWNAVRAEQPELYKGFNPWDRINDPLSLRALLQESGIEDAEVVAESGTQPINSPEDWWSIVMGSGYRGTIEQLAPAARERIRRANLSALEAAPIREVATNVIYARATKS